MTTPIKLEPTVLSSSSSSSIVAKHSHQQIAQENEQFALSWLRATFESVTTLASRIEQQDLYKMYMTASSKIGRQGVVTSMHFPRCVRSVFGGTVGPNQIKVKQNHADVTALYYEGIRIRAKPLAIVHKGTILVSNICVLYIQEKSISKLNSSKGKCKPQKWLSRRQTYQHWWNSKARELRWLVSINKESQCCWRTWPPKW